MSKLYFKIKWFKTLKFTFSGKLCVLSCVIVAANERYVFINVIEMTIA